jgi:hypothetical protein
VCHDLGKNFKGGGGYESFSTKIDYIKNDTIKMRTKRIDGLADRGLIKEKKLASLLSAGFQRMFNKRLPT